MNHLRRAAFGIGFLALLAVPTTSCQLLNELGGDIISAAPRPSASLAGLRFSDLRLDGVGVIADVRVDNPYPVPIYARELGFELLSGGNSLISGLTDQALNVPARSSNTVPVRLDLPFRNVFSSMSGVRPGQVIPFTTKLDVSMVGEDVSPLNFSLTRDGELPVPAPPAVDMRGIQWDELGLTNARGTMRMGLRNTNEFPVNLGALDYTLGLAGARVAQGRTGQGLSLAPGEEGELAIGLDLRPQDMGIAAFRALTGSDAAYELNGTMSFQTPFGPMNLPLERTGRASLR